MKRPPKHFNCRCVVALLDVEAAIEELWTEEPPPRFAVWIDCMCGLWPRPYWEMNWPEPLSLPEALDMAAETRAAGYPTVVKLFGEGPP